jgi:aerobic carbon-monoxide dehydrogenase medium subunit
VKPPRFEYHRAASLGEAVEVKARYGDEASVLAGGQSLIPMLNFRLVRPTAVVDIGGIDALRQVALDKGTLRVGAMTRQRSLERLLEAKNPHSLVLQALRHIAHPIIRNRGTVGGSLAHADPAAELPAALLALDGQVKVANSVRDRWIQARDLFLFHLTTSLDDDEILVEAEFPAPDRPCAAAVAEVSQRHGDFAAAGVCAALNAAEDGRSIASARLAYFGIATTPVRADAAEHLLAGEQPSQPLFRAAGKLASAHCLPHDQDDTATDYRRQLVVTVTERALAAASERLKAGRHLR